jgi:hypothetical protein
MRATDPTKTRELERALLRFNSRLLGTTVGLMASAGLFAATLILLAHGDENPGRMLGELHHLFPGYRVSVGGAFAGAAWAGAVGYALGFVVAHANGRWVLRETAHRTEASRDAGDPQCGVAVLSPLPAGLVMGALLALGLLAATNWLWFRYGFESPHLALLRHYLPGYTTDPAGSLIGAFWMFCYGFVGAGAIAWIYDRVVAFRFPHSS